MSPIAAGLYACAAAPVIPTYILSVRRTYECLTQDGERGLRRATRSLASPVTLWQWHRADQRRYAAQKRTTR